MSKTVVDKHMSLELMISVQPFKMQDGKRRIAGMELGFRQFFPFKELANEELFRLQWKDIGEKIYRALIEHYWELRLMKKELEEVPE